MGEDRVFISLGTSKLLIWYKLFRKYTSAGITWSQCYENQLYLSIIINLYNLIDNNSFSYFVIRRDKLNK